MQSHDVTRVVICEDSRTYAEALAGFLETDRDLRVVGRADTSSSALELVARLDPDLILMDLELGDGDSTDTVRRIMARHPRPVVVLSAHTTWGARRAACALAAGALIAVA